MEADSRDRNVRAHEGLDRLGFPHRAVNRFVIRRIREHFRQLPSGPDAAPRVLDVGCGTGFLVQEMLKTGWDAFGVDPYPRGAATRPPLDERITTGTIESIPGEPFHAVTSVEVLEHIEDYRGLIIEMLNVLRPGGILVATVPNNWEFQAVAGPDGKMEPKHGHLWRFTAEGLGRDLSLFGDGTAVTPIYSASLDRRLFRFVRLLPVPTVLSISDARQRRNHDGAWLLASVIREPGEDLIGGTDGPPAALSWRSAPPFNEGSLHDAR